MSSRGTASALVRVVAQAPCWEACEHFGAHRVVEGMQCLSADRLRSALDRAIGQAAGHFGVGRARIERQLDQECVSGLLSELRAHHPACERMARDHGASLTSFAVERVTISAGAVAYLSALANRFSDDRFIAEPVSGLAALIARWDALLDGFGERLETDSSLLGARRRKLATRAVAAVALTATIAALAAWGGWAWFVVKRSQQRLQLVLDAPNPCVAASVDQAALRHARPDQLTRLQERRSGCDALVEKQAREERCDQLASRIEAGKWDESDLALAAGSAALLRRVADRALIASDLMAGPGALPCQDSAAGARLWGAFARVAGSSESLWATAEQVSPRLLAIPELSLSSGSRDALSSHAESVSRRAIVVGLPEALAHARTLCGLQAALEVPWERGCKAIDRLSARK